MSTRELPGNISIRTGLRPGDLGSIVRLHGIVYALEKGWDATFESYVAGPLAEFVRSHDERQRLWIAECSGVIVGCIAIVPASVSTAQLRWFLVDPSVRGLGLGTALLCDALGFCEESGYEQVFLWTEQSLAAAAKLYRLAGFKRTEVKPGNMWGSAVVEEKYELILNAGKT